MPEWERVPLGEVIRHRKEFITIDDLTDYKRCRVQVRAQGIVLRDEVPGSAIKTKKQQVCRVKLSSSLCKICRGALQRHCSSYQCDGVFLPYHELRRRIATSIH